MNRLDSRSRAEITVIMGAFVVALLLGLASPRGDRARAVTEDVELRVNPGPRNSPAVLNCLWHTVCGGAGGNALDWKNNSFSNEPIFWRSWGYRTYTGNGRLGTGMILQTDGTCSQVSVAVTDEFAFAKGSVRYTHSRTWIPTATFNIGASPSWSYTSGEIGFSWDDELTNCKAAFPPLWTGQHLHQYADAANFPDNNTSGIWTTGMPYDVTSWWYWQQRQMWQWNY